MSVRFFKKLTPATVVVLGNNATCTFTTLDGVTGYFATDNPYVASEFERFMREQRYAISEISAQEFHADYVEKKKQFEAIEGALARGDWKQWQGNPKQPDKPRPCCGGRRKK